jgi:hypothetical protein
MRSIFRAGYAAEIDTSLTGVSFIDILFALAVAAILQPVEQRVEHPVSHPLPAANVVGLAVVLTLVLGSFIGHHNSSSKPRFKIRFLNSSFIKFTLDMMMVIVYFVLAAFAAKSPIDLDAEATLLCVTFLLYSLWDCASLYEAHRSKYEKEWKRALELDLITDPWKKYKRIRMVPTVVCLTIFLLIRILLIWKTAPHSFEFTMTLSLLFIFVIFGYRFWKDFLSCGRAENVAAS